MITFTIPVPAMARLARLALETDAADAGSRDAILDLTRA